MKKILFALLSCITLALPASGAKLTLDSVIVEAPVLEYAAKAFFKTEDSRKQVLQKYRDLLGTGAAGLNAQNAWDVCAAGVDIKSADGRKQCTDFISYVTRYNNKYYDVCDNFSSIPSKYQSGSRCEKDFFNWTNVQMLSAVALAQEYAKIKWNEDIICSNEYREGGNDDWVQCRSLKSGVFFEFKFDDVRESKDVDIKTDIRIALCKMHGGKSDEDTNGYHCEINTSICTSKLADSTKRFGGKAYYDTKKDVCLIEYNTVNAKDGLKTACGIDNFMFCRDIQVDTTVGLQESLKRQVARSCNIDLSQVRCDNNFNTYKGEGCKVSRTAPKDDIISCYYGSQQIDFVFDDVNELNRTLADGGKQGVGCMAMGGVYDGEYCADLTEDMCNQVARLDKEKCPSCEAARWNREDEICELPSSKTAKNYKTAINVLSNTGVAIAGVALTIVTAGTGTAAVIMITAASAGAAAAAVSDGAKIVQDSNASDWVVEMNKINTPAAADAFLRKHLNEIMGAAHLDENRRKGVDDMLSRVLGNASDSYFEELVSGCVAEPEEGLIEYDTTLPTCALNPQNGNNTASTVIKVADTIQFIAGVVMIVTGLVQTATTISTRAGSVVDKIDDLKATGWIRDGNKWVNQTTGETLSKLPKGVPGWDPNPALRGGGRWRGLLYGNGNVGSFTKKADLIKWVTNNHVITEVSKVWNPNLYAVAVGAADVATSGSDTNLANVQIPGRNNTTPGGDTNPPKDGNPGGGNVSGDTDVFIDLDKVVVTAPKVERKIKGLEVGDTTPKIPTFTATPPAKKPSESTTPVVTPTVTPEQETPVPVVTPTVTPEQETPVPVVTPTVTTVPGSVAPIEPLKNVEPVKTEKKRNTAAIAIGSVLAVGATGGLVGGLVAKNKRDERREANKLTTVPVATPFVGAGNQLTNEMNALLGTAGGVLGYVNGKELKLIPLPTVVNTYSTIVQINVRAVVVVDYNGYKLPYYVEPTAGSWRPLLGIGQMGGWFNTYPSDTGITTIDSITNTLNQILAPANVSKFVGGAAGASFPVAAPAAYQIINAEFPNGVVQTYNGTFTPADQALYNSNYNKMKNAL